MGISKIKIPQINKPTKHKSNKWQQSSNSIHLYFDNLAHNTWRNFTFSFPKKPIKHMEIHTNIKFLFFSKAFLVPKQRLNKKKKPKSKLFISSTFLATKQNPWTIFQKKNNNKKKKGCTIPKEIDGGDVVATLALGREIISVGTAVLTADWWLARWLEATAWREREREVGDKWTKEKKEKRV